MSSQRMEQKRDGGSEAGRSIVTAVAQTRPAQTTPPKFWSKLPPELSLPIIDMVAEDHRFQSSSPRVRAGYATVCKQWQPVFEQRNFQKLTLDQHRVVKLNVYMSKYGRLDYIEHVFLRVRFDRYDCTVCQLAEDEPTIHRNSTLFGLTLALLLTTLSQWPQLEPTVGRYGRQKSGITLEFGAYSPSDCEHTFRDFHLEPDYPYQEIQDLEDGGEAYRRRAKRLEQEKLTDPFHDWIDGKRPHDGPRLWGAKRRVLGKLRIYGLLGDPVYPKVPVVRGFLIRRQFYRQPRVEDMGKLIKKCFTKLEWFRHEPCLAADGDERIEFLHRESNACAFRVCRTGTEPFADGTSLEYLALLRSGCIPKTLRHLYIFQDFNTVLHPESPYVHRDVGGGMSRELATVSRRLETLSVAFIMDAENFFTAFWPHNDWSEDDFKDDIIKMRPWKKLRKLALTTGAFGPMGSKFNRDRLLAAAGRAAALMPKLEILELWDAGTERNMRASNRASYEEGHAVVFRYEYDGKFPNITFAPNKAVMLLGGMEMKTCRLWDKLPQHGPHSRLSILYKGNLGRFSTMTENAAAIKHLELRGEVLHPLSLYQLLEYEGMGEGDMKHGTESTEA